MQIHGINKLTLLDYPGKLACLIFTGKCNFRCPFCHNSTLVLAPDTQPLITEKEVFDYLLSRRQVLEGVCISGGEPTLQPDLAGFIEEVRALGYSIKLDTNGSRPAVIKDLLSRNIIDYIAMDVKNSPEQYSETIGIDSYNTDNIKESIRIIMDSGIEYEFRTTLVEEFHKNTDFNELGQMIKGAKHMYLQGFRDSDDIIQPGLHAMSDEQMYEVLRQLTPYVQDIALRGVD